MEAAGPIPLFAKRFVTLCVHECVGLLRLVFGSRVESQMPIDLTKLVVGGRELRIQLDVMLECLLCPRPILSRCVEFAELKRRIRGVGFQLCRMFECIDRFLLAAQAAGQKTKVIFQKVTVRPLGPRIFKDVNCLLVIALAGIGLGQADICGIKFRVVGKRRMEGIARGGIVALDHLNRA